MENKQLLRLTSSFIKKLIKIKLKYYLKFTYMQIRMQAPTSFNPRTIPSSLDMCKLALTLKKLPAVGKIWTEKVSNVFGQWVSANSTKYDCVSLCIYRYISVEWVR